MSLDRPTRIEVEHIPVGTMALLGVYPSAVTSAVITDYLADHSEVLISLPSNQIVQGDDLFEDPVTFGGIAPDLTSWGGPDVVNGLWPVTTTMPTQGTMIADRIHIIDVGIFAVKEWKENGAVCYNPSKNTSFIGGEGLVFYYRSIFRPPVRIRIYGVSSCWLGYVGDVYVLIENNYVNGVLELGDGEIAIEPVVLRPKDSDMYAIIEY